MIRLFGAALIALFLLPIAALANNGDTTNASWHGACINGGLNAESWVIVTSGTLANSNYSPASGPEQYQVRGNVDLMNLSAHSVNVGIGMFVGDATNSSYTQISTRTITITALSRQTAPFLTGLALSENTNDNQGFYIQAILASSGVVACVGADSIQEITVEPADGFLHNIDTTTNAGCDAGTISANTTVKVAHGSANPAMNGVSATAIDAFSFFNDISLVNASASPIQVEYELWWGGASCASSPSGCYAPPARSARFITLPARLSATIPSYTPVPVQNGAGAIYQNGVSGFLIEMTPTQQIYCVGNDWAADVTNQEGGLTVSVVGASSGTVTDNTGTINCGNQCAGLYAPGAVVTLMASANSGCSFPGWSGGACSGTGTCVVTMSAAQSVTATFTCP